MNIFNKITTKSLKKNRVRTIVTVIGIMLSTAMICAVTTFVSSMQNYFLESAVYNNGSWHGSTFNNTFQDFVDIANNKKVSCATYGQSIGYTTIDSKNKYKPYIYVLGCDEEHFFEMLPVHLIAGNLPRNSSEIILPEHLESDAELIYNIGDTITLELGERMFQGRLLSQKDPCFSFNSEKNESVINDEVIEKKETRTYTVVGFYKRPSFEDYSAPGYTALTLSDKQFTENSCFSVYFKMNDASKVYNFLDGEVRYNTVVLMGLGVTKYDNFYKTMLELSVVVIGIIMFASILLIYNAFSISVFERTKQFGLLFSVGATRKQIRKMVMFESVCVSVIGILIGVVLGIGGTGVTLLLIGNKFNSMIGGSYEIPMKVCISWESILISIVMSFVTVLISAWIPSKRAARVSAIEAIRQDGVKNFKDKPRKTMKLTYKIFGLSGLLASKYYNRNKKKYRPTIISLFISIVIFVSASAFTDYFTELVVRTWETERCDLVYSPDKEENLKGKTFDDIFEILSSGKEVTDVVQVRGAYFDGTISNKYLTDYFAVNDQDEKKLSGFLYFVNDSEFNNLLDLNSLSKDEYYNPQRPRGIAVDDYTRFDKKTQRFLNQKILKNDTSEIVVSFQNSDLGCTLNSAKTINESPFYVSKMDYSTLPLQMIYPMSMMDYVIPNNSSVRDRFYEMFYLTSRNHAASYENLKSILKESGLKYKDLEDLTARVEDKKNNVFIMKILAYGFVILISLVAIANVFNTITTNIGLRRREFAMMRSVGMTKKGFNKMMSYECILYGTKALIFGVPASIGITYLIYKIFLRVNQISYHLPLKAIGTSIFSVFAIVFVSMIYSMNKVNKSKLVDALKNENL